eukprot:gnl/Hemi2/24422_TR8211_c0_g1_i1.p1 gnl/Hemi2/24422_TR8211_c0_g1~~gnl/Hemi2/24422_TR8211_c0_g1_i1.p1  ORF type:complete len:435 (-),score=140.77 gnl/Hemi2/24422_TR8211_c0_g1_i1:163-1467(-)
MGGVSFVVVLSLSLVLLLACVHADDNGRALTPPLGWRSWNQYECGVSQADIEATFRALADRSRLVDGVPTSLADLGYVDAGLDDCWQLCGAYGPQNYTYHNASGFPVVNTTRFPDMAGMVAAAHALGLRAGFYGNNCDCRDHCSDESCFQGDVAAMVAWGFDSVKLDGCGKQKNTTLWRALFNATSPKPVMIENCHNGIIPTDNTPATCPYHMYRSSTDIAPCYGSILANLQTVVPLAAKGLSYPGCWAYPDMLEVMTTNTQGTMPLLTAIESRTHFGLWAIVSSPLILGFDLTNATLMDAAWSFITHREVLAINQAWHGFSGSIFYSSPVNSSFTPCGWWLPNCSFPSAQYLYKPVTSSAMAVMLVNNGNTTVDLEVKFADIPSLPAQPAYHVRDVWNRQDLGLFKLSFTAKSVLSHDSALLLITLQCGVAGC